MTGMFIVASNKAAQNPAFQNAIEDARSGGQQVAVHTPKSRDDMSACLEDLRSDGQTQGTLVAAGGDGTLNAVFGMAYEMGLHEQYDFGILPLGTANDFATAAGIPANDLGAAMDIAANGPVHTVDLGLRDGEPFINAITGGFGAQVTVETDPELKQRLGGLAYIISGLARLGEVNRHEGRFQGESFEWEGRFLAMAVCNGPQAGGGIPLCPDARIDDGQLELMIVPDLADQIRLPSLDELLTQNDDTDQFIVRSRGNRFSFTSDVELPLNSDGEPERIRSFEASCLAGALRMRLPHSDILGR